MAQRFHDEEDIEGGMVIGRATSKSARSFARWAKLYFLAQASLIVAGVVSLICSDEEEDDYDFLWTLWVAYGCVMLLQAYQATVHFSCRSGQVHSKVAAMCVMGGLAVFFFMARTGEQDNGLKVASAVFFVGGMVVLNVAAASTMSSAYKHVRGAQCSGARAFCDLVHRRMVSPPDDSDVSSGSTTAVTPADVQRTPAKNSRVAVVPPVMAKGVEDKSDAHQFFCPICMLFYASIYRTACCANYVCDHCTPQFVKGMAQADEKADALESTSDCPYCNKADLCLERVRRGETARRYDDSPHVKSKIAGAMVGDPAQSPLKVGDSFEAMKKKMIGFDGRSFSRPFSTPRKQDKVYPASSAGDVPRMVPTPSSASVAIPEHPGAGGGDEGGLGGTGSSLPGTPDDMLSSPAPGGASPTRYAGPGAELPPRARGPRPLLPVFMSTEMESARPITPSGIDASSTQDAVEGAASPQPGEEPLSPQTPSPGHEGAAVRDASPLTDSSPITPGAVEAAVGGPGGGLPGEGGVIQEGEGGGDSQASPA